MTDSDNNLFYARREATQRRLAARAVDPFIAAIHNELAEEYAAKITRDPGPSLRLVI